MSRKRREDDERDLVPLAAAFTYPSQQAGYPVCTNTSNLGQRIWVQGRSGHNVLLLNDVCPPGLTLPGRSCSASDNSTPAPISRRGGRPVSILFPSVAPLREATSAAVVARQPDAAPTLRPTRIGKQSCLWRFPRTHHQQLPVPIEPSIGVTGHLATRPAPAVTLKVHLPRAPTRPPLPSGFSRPRESWRVRNHRAAWTCSATLRAPT